MGTQVASKSGEPLELFKEDTKLSYDTAHHANQKYARSFCTTKSSNNEYNQTASSFIVCTNRFEPLMEEVSMSDDSDI